MESNFEYGASTQVKGSMKAVFEGKTIKDLAPWLMKRLNQWRSPGFGVRQPSLQ